jgi:hypothetical protein
LGQGTRLQELAIKFMLAPDTYIRSDAVVSRAIAGETLVIPVRGSVGDLASIYSLNEVGTMIWDALAEPMSVEEMASLIESKYQVDRDRAHRDVGLFVTEMAAAGLVVANSGDRQDVGDDSSVLESAVSG